MEDEKEKQEGAHVPLKRDIVWQLMLEGSEGTSAVEGAFAGIKTLNDLIKKATVSLGPTAIEEISKDIEILSNVVNSEEMREVPEGTKDLIVSLFEDIVKIVTEGSAELKVQKNVRGT